MSTFPHYIYSSQEVKNAKNPLFFFICYNDYFFWSYSSFVDRYLFTFNHECGCYPPSLRKEFIKLIKGFPLSFFYDDSVLRLTREQLLEFYGVDNTFRDYLDRDTRFLKIMLKIYDFQQLLWDAYCRSEFPWWIITNFVGFKFDMDGRLVLPHYEFEDPYISMDNLPMKKVVDKMVLKLRFLDDSVFQSSLLSFYDINYNLNIIWLDFLVWLFFLIFFGSYIYRVILSPTYLYNNDYLWRCFREEQQLDFNNLNWLKDDATLEVLESYTKQLSGLDLKNSNPDDLFIKNTKTYKKLAAEFVKYNLKKTKHMDLMSNLRRRFSKKKKKKSLNHINKIMKLAIKLREIQVENNIKFNPELFSNLTTSTSFDYTYILLILIIRIIIKLF